MAAKGVETTCYPIKDWRTVKTLMEKPPHRERLLFSIGFFTGLRINEILSLQWKDVIVLDKGRPVVLTEARPVISKQTKLTGRLRVRPVPLMEELREKIMAYFRFLNEPALDEYVFSERRRRMDASGPISRLTANRMVKKYLSLYQIDVKGNDSSTILRKTFAWFYYQRNGLEMTQKALGHSSSADTLRYLGITEEVVSAGYANFYDQVDGRKIVDMVEDGDLDLKTLVKQVKKFPRVEWRARLRDELRLYTTDDEDIAATVRIAFLI